jgi:hypothetical protein
MTNIMAEKIVLLILVSADYHFQARLLSGIGLNVVIMSVVAPKSGYNQLIVAHLKRLTRDNTGPICRLRIVIKYSDNGPSGL